MRVPAGFPSPAQDYLAKRIDLNEHLVHHPGSTFFVQVVGDSMFPEISDGDMVVVDRSAEITNGCIVLASIDNEYCIKRYYKRPDGGIELVPTNKKYESVNLPDECVFEIFGKVTSTITQFK
jgi:DNA polymerase V